MILRHLDRLGYQLSLLLTLDLLFVLFAEIYGSTFWALLKVQFFYFIRLNRFTPKAFVSLLPAALSLAWLTLLTRRLGNV
jgi:hypothetical protein